MKSRKILRIRCFLLFLILQGLHSIIFAQLNPPGDLIDYEQIYLSVMEEYGLDQVLVNGLVYKDKYWKKEGHQFFLEDQLYEGTLVFKGMEFKGLEMKYDLCDQEVIIYLNHNYSTIGFVPPEDFISDFYIDGKHFSKYNIQGKPGYYQVVFDSDNLKCLYHWSKQIQETNDGGNSRYYYYKFDNSKKKCYLDLGGSFETYRNNKSFTGLFPLESRLAIRQYLKTNRIKIAKSRDKEIIELLTYCVNLSEAKE